MTTWHSLPSAWIHNLRWLIWLISWLTRHNFTSAYRYTADWLTDSPGKTLHESGNAAVGAVGVWQAEDEWAAHRFRCHTALRSVNLPVRALTCSANMQMKVQMVRVIYPMLINLCCNSMLIVLGFRGEKTKMKNTMKTHQQNIAKNTGKNKLVRKKTEWMQQPQSLTDRSIPLWDTWSSVSVCCSLYTPCGRLNIVLGTDGLSGFSVK